MYNCNNLQNCCEIVKKLLKSCEMFNEHFYSLFSQTYLLRCYLKMGDLKLDALQQLYSLAKEKKFFGQDFLQFSMDYAAILGNNEKAR